LRGSASVDIIARFGFCKYYRVTKTKARRRKPPDILPKQKRGPVRSVPAVLPERSGTDKPPEG